MNKKLLFGIMSLAALTACTSDDFESQEVAQNVSPIQFEVINGQDDAFTRASMNGNKITWNAKDGDLFTLYHGRTTALPAAAPWGVDGFENATYRATEGKEGSPATLTTPSMIKSGFALMVWPVDTTFRIDPTKKLSIKILADQTKDIENHIPYVSDLINIFGYGSGYDGTHLNGTTTEPNSINTAGYNRTYPVFMRPMASQLTIKADYATTDETIATLYEGGSEGLTGDDAVEPIKVTSVELLTNPAGTTKFTTQISLKFDGGAGVNWGSVPNNAWVKPTGLDVTDITAQTAKLTTKCLTDNSSSKFLILPQTAMDTPGSGVDAAAVVVNTIYGKVVVAPNGVQGSQYNAAPDESADAWYRYRKAGAALADGETETAIKNKAGDSVRFTSNVELGLKQTINGFGTATASSGYAQGEQVGVHATRYVKVLLTHLDMSGLHINNDKQLRDAARVWKKMGLTPVTVYLDGDANNEFAISQKTIKVINDINNGTLNFQVKPCKNGGEVCNTIVITGGGDVPNIPFITYNDVDLSTTLDATEYIEDADVALNAGETWNWKGTVKVADDGVVKIINRGTMENGATATLKTTENGGAQNNVPFVNNGTWNVTAGTLNVQFDVTNNGTLNIAKGAQYRQDGQVQDTEFVNDALNKPSRFGGNDSEIGTVVNKGVFATVAAAGKTAEINNYGLIEHADNDAKTYVTRNQLGGSTFANGFNAATNKIGRINLPYSNKDEDNVSVSAALTDGFISVTVDGEVSGALNATVVGPRVNYVIVKSGITSIATLPTPQIKYLEIDMTDKSEIAWSVTGTRTFDGLMVLSDVNVKLGTKVISTVTYLGSDMYVGGKFNNAAIAAEGTDPAFAATNYNGYYGNTSGNVSTKYITY